MCAMASEAGPGALSIDTTPIFRTGDPCLDSDPSLPAPPKSPGTTSMSYADYAATSGTPTPVARTACRVLYDDVSFVTTLRKTRTKKFLENTGGGKGGGSKRKVRDDVDQSKPGKKATGKHKIGQGKVMEEASASELYKAAKIVDLEAQIKKLKQDMAKLQEETDFYFKDANNKASDAEHLRKRIAELRRGDDIDQVLEAVQRRLDRECDFSLSTHAYPTTLIKLTDMVREETKTWGHQSDPTWKSHGSVEEPDSKSYDIHKYLAIFVAGRNLAMAAQNLHPEVVRTVDRMTDRYLAEEHPMTETLTCPILKTRPFKDPVTVGSGITFERSAIEDWFKQEREENGAFTQHRCPTTRKIVDPTHIQTNVIVNQIQDNNREVFKADFPTKFSTPLDFSMPYIKTDAIHLGEGENVSGCDRVQMADDDNYAPEPQRFPPFSFDPFDYHRKGVGKSSFTFD